MKFGSLPNRQLRKQGGGLYVIKGGSLPNRQLRNARGFAVVA